MAFQNSYHIYVNSPNISHSDDRIKLPTFPECKAELNRNWKWKCLNSNGVNVRSTPMKLSVEDVKKSTMSISDNHKLVHIDPQNKKRKRRCIVCGARSPWQCSGCKNDLKMHSMVVICHPDTERPCFDTLHPEQ